MHNHERVQRELAQEYIPIIKDSLTIIISNLQLLSEEKPDHPAINRYLELIDEARKINRAIDILFSLRPGMK